MNRPLHILVAPLDWGLGHATRCVPLIWALQERGVKVYAAGDERAQKIITEACPGVEWLPLFGYRVRYARRGFWLPWLLMAQVPRLLGVLRREHEWLDEVLGRVPLDAVISDNRYGLNSAKCCSVFMTHQLHVRVPFGRVGRCLADQLHAQFIRRFDTCWVPDGVGEGLAGSLSQALPGVQASWLGPLSRFGRKPVPQVPGYDLVFLLSGPEPQRSLLEAACLRSIPDGLRALLVEGRPEEGETIRTGAEADRVGHLGAEQLEAVLRSCRYLVCRSGYSTLMDLACIGRSALLIPTPGQSEQEYLAALWHERGWAVAMRQGDLNREAIQEWIRSGSGGGVAGMAGNRLAEVLDEWLQALKGVQGHPARMSRIAGSQGPVTSA